MFIRIKAARKFKFHVKIISGSKSVKKDKKNVRKSHKLDLYCVFWYFFGLGYRIVISPDWMISSQSEIEGLKPGNGLGLSANVVQGLPQLQNY